MGRVLVLGSINTDLVASVTQLPRTGETVIGGGFAVYGGGKGSNQAIAAARAGARVIMAGCLGDDAYGADRLADLEREGIDTTAVRRLAGAASGIALIAVDASGQNTIIVIAGANGQVTEAMAAALPCGPGDVVLSELEVPLAVAAATLRRAQQTGARATLNVSPTHPHAGSLLGLTDLLVVNEVEAGDLLGETVTAASGPALARLAARGPRQIVVTLGADGAIAWDQGRLLSAPALPVTPVDTTGAGDAFCGALAAGLAAGLDLGAALRRGVVAGSLAVTRHGAQSSLPTRDEIEAALGRLPAAG